MVGTHTSTYILVALGWIPFDPICSDGPVGTSGIAIMPRRTMQGILSIVQHYIQKMLARETKSIFSFRPFLSKKISKIKKMKKIFPISFLSHFDWWGIYYKNLWESVWYFFFHESYQLFRSIYSFKNNWEIKTLIKPSVELKT